MKIKLYYHTVKYLKISQIYYRFFKLLVSPTVHQIFPKVNQSSGVWVDTKLYQQKLFDNGEVKFLNERGQINKQSDWNASSKTKLWLYNLHYFDDLNAIGAVQRKERQTALVEQWISENPPPLGNGWEPYPTSLRIVNWVKSFLGHIQPSQNMLNSLAQQADFLSQDLEKHLLGNHYFANAKALIFAGLFLNSEKSKIWLKKGLGIIEKELKEQVLADGGNFELSPMYHSIMLIDVLDLVNIIEAFPSKNNNLLVGKLRQVASLMIHWLRVMSHGDGEISFFNDSAFRIAPAQEKILEYASELGVDVTAKKLTRYVLLEHSGYSRISMAKHTVIFDHAQVGPKYQPAHAHADTLSIEWSIGEQRVLVNSGTSLYGTDERRAEQRSTALHNTVEVNGENSSEVWAGFRVARRAKITSLGSSVDDSTVEIIASHDGYRRLKKPVSHSRCLKATENTLSVHDSLEGSWENARALFYLHPDIVLVGTEERKIKLSVGGDKTVIVESNEPVGLEDAHWYPEFGVSLPNKRLVIAFRSSEAWVKFTIESE